MPRALLVLLHGLGCSARTWDEVRGRLGDEFDVLALDLPGHGANTGSAALTVEQMADFVLAEIVRRRPARWAMVGHSMGGKVAMIVASRAERGAADIPAPLALVLVATSPLAVEPMAEDKRSEMVEWCAHGSVSGEHARSFVDANTATQLPAEPRGRAVADVRGVARTAWLAWLERGSVEDWTDTVGVLHTPTLVVAGAEDEDLGAAAQRSLTLPHVAATDVSIVPDAAHLIMLEQPDRLADLVAGHVRGVQATLGELPDAFAELILSDRVSARTRGVLLERLAPPGADDRVLDNEQRRVLESLVRRVVPQRATAVDLASRLEAGLAARTSDGWRFAELPDGVEAWRRGLDTLAAARFADLPPDEMDGWIERMIDGGAGSEDRRHLTGEQMTLWFEDVRAEAIRAWVSHPSAMAHIGYDGFANGGDGPRKQGYLRVAMGEREAWQPAPTERAPEPPS